MNPLFVVGDRVEYVGTGSRIPQGTLGSVVGTRTLGVKTNTGQQIIVFDVAFVGLSSPGSQTIVGVQEHALRKISSVSAAGAVNASTLPVTKPVFVVGDPIEWIGTSRHILPGARGTITGPAGKSFWIVDFGGMSRNCGENELRKVVAAPSLPVTSAATIVIPVAPTFVEIDFIISAPTVDLSRYPGKCPKCGQPAYVGFSSTDCSNASCGARR